MIIYNVTVKISHEKHDEWMQWMQSVHIPAVMDTGKFSKYVFSKVLVEDEEGTNYSIQYFTESMEILKEYQTDHAPGLASEHQSKYGEYSVAFRTLLEIVE